MKTQFAFQGNMDKAEYDCCKNSAQTIQNQESEQKTDLISSTGPFEDTYEIDHRVLPYIFRFNYAALQKLRMSRAHYVPSLAHEIFFYLKDKLIVGRYSEGSRFANRMKFEQKIKFVIRAFDHGYTVSQRKVISQKCQNFNRQSQIQFFQREEVKKHFLDEIQKALIRKKAENERRIQYLERFIGMAIEVSRNDIEAARQIFQDKVKRKQLPWTDNMFMDISEFSRILFVRFTKPKPLEQKRILEMGLGEDGRWQMNEKMENISDFDDLEQEDVPFQKSRDVSTKMDEQKK